jgi:hypothetical protein
MLKTITQQQPLFYSFVIAQQHRQRMLREKFVKAARGVSFVLYVAGGLRVSADTGFAPWDWRFWAILCPLFLFGEWSLFELSRWLLSSRSARQGFHLPTTPHFQIRPFARRARHSGGIEEASAIGSAIARAS